MRFKFQGGNFSQASLMARGLTEFCFKKSLHQFPRQFRTFDASTQANQIKIVVLDPLSRGEMVFNQAGADAFDFIGTDGRANAAAANGHAAIHLCRSQRPAQRNDEIRIIIVQSQLMGPEVHDLVTGQLEPGCQ